MTFWDDDGIGKWFLLDMSGCIALGRVNITWVSLCIIIITTSPHWDLAISLLPCDKESSEKNRHSAGFFNFGITEETLQSFLVWPRKRCSYTTTATSSLRHNTVFGQADSPLSRQL